MIGNGEMSRTTRLSRTSGFTPFSDKLPAWHRFATGQRRMAVNFAKLPELFPRPAADEEAAAVHFHTVRATSAQTPNSGSIAAAHI
jgi:hypothetical protein